MYHGLAWFPVTAARVSNVRAQPAFSPTPRGSIKSALDLPNHLETTHNKPLHCKSATPRSPALRFGEMPSATVHALLRCIRACHVSCCSRNCPLPLQTFRRAARTDKQMAPAAWAWSRGATLPLAQLAKQYTADALKHMNGAMSTLLTCVLLRPRPPSTCTELLIDHHACRLVCRACASQLDR